jgi:hypothetical protein
MQDLNGICIRIPSDKGGQFVGVAVRLTPDLSPLEIRPMASSASNLYHNPNTLSLVSLFPPYLVHTPTHVLAGT